MEIKHPGTALKNELAVRGITQKQFAAMIGMGASHLSERITGKIAFTHTFAKKLEAVLQIEAQEWMDMQLQYIYAQRCASKQEATFLPPPEMLVLSVSITDVSLLSDIKRTISMLKGVGHVTILGQDE